MGPAMSGSWKVTLPCRRADAEALGDDIPAFALLDAPPSLVTSEIDEDTDQWQLDAYFADKPGKADLAALVSLVPGATVKGLAIEQLDDADWVTISQSGIEPVTAGRFYVHTQSNRGTPPPGAVIYRIDAGRAFGTGTHETTSGCLAMLDSMARRGERFRDIADIGTGTGLLAFAALELWPRARATASDIDPVSIEVTQDNAALNAVKLGRRPGTLACCVATGTDHALIRARAPYDLVIANILAGPLIALAPDLAAITAPGGTVILAGLMAGQAEAVLAAYHAAGFRLEERRDKGDWPCLRLTKRHRHGYRRKQRALHRGSPSDASFGSW